MDKIVWVYLAQQVGNIQELQALHLPDWLRSSKDHHHDTEPAVYSSQPALAPKMEVPALASGQPEGGQAYISYKCKA